MKRAMLILLALAAVTMGQADAPAPDFSKYDEKALRAALTQWYSAAKDWKQKSETAEKRLASLIASAKIERIESEKTKATLDDLNARLRDAQAEAERLRAQLTAALVDAEKTRNAQATTKPADSVAAPNAAAPVVSKPKGERWEATPSRVRIGAAQVTVEAVGVDKVQLKTMAGGSASANPALKIRLLIENTSDTAKLNYSTWRWDQGAFKDSEARISDEHGNSYAPIGFGLMTEVVGAGTSGSLYPRKGMNDLLLFEVPIDNAVTLKLRLPNSNIGGAGTSIIEIKRVLN